MIQAQDFTSSRLEASLDQGLEASLVLVFVFKPDSELCRLLYELLIELSKLSYWTILL